MAIDSSGLVRAAMLLRGEAPAAWTGFVGALEEYAAGVTAEIMRADPSVLMRAQGMALMVHEISAILRDAPKTFDKMQQLQRGKPDGRRPDAGGFRGSTA